MTHPTFQTVSRYFYGREAIKSLVRRGVPVTRDALDGEIATLQAAEQAQHEEAAAAGRLQDLEQRLQRMERLVERAPREEL